MSLSIVFAGTPNIAATHLQALIDAGHNVIAAYSQPDRPSGRGKKLHPTPVKALALNHNIPVYQPLNFKNDADLQALAALKPDLMVVVAYGLLLPKSVLSIPRYGCINVHASLLPKWRGAAPIERAIATGDDKTGVTIMQMDEGLDTGDMLYIDEIPISARTTGDSLREEVGIVGSQALLATLIQLQAKTLSPQKQNNELASYAHKLTKEEAQINWQLPAMHIDKTLRAFNSANVCFSIYQQQRIKIWQAQPLDLTHNASPGEILSVDKKGICIACGEGVLQLQQLQLPNANKMDVAAILNGKKDFFSAGQCFE
jgi:methionyl-tRNA formyltransferase